MARKTHLLWDHDGVLVHTEPWYFEATRRCIEPLGVHLDLSAYLQDMVFGTPSWRHASALGASEARIVAARKERDRVYQQFLQHEDIEIPGVDQVLTQLSREFEMAIVTTAKRSDFELIHKRRSIVSHMAFVLASGDYPRAKPHPDPYITALQRFNIPPERALVIEDSQRGLKAALAAGIDCVIVHNDFVQSQDFTDAQHRIRRLEELPALLARLNQPD